MPIHGLKEKKESASHLVIIIVSAITVPATEFTIQIYSHLCVHLLPSLQVLSRTTRTELLGDPVDGRREKREEMRHARSRGQLSHHGAHTP